MELLQLAAALGIAIYVVNVCYGFDGTFRPLGEYNFVSAALGGDSNNGNRFRDTVLGSLPVPVPRDYVLGIDVQKRDFETGFRSYLLGAWQQGGWWYYYLVALAVKVPLGAWALIAAATVLRLTRFRRVIPCHQDLLLLAPALLILFLVSSQTGFSHHMRYVVPMFPFVMIWMSQVVCAMQGHLLQQLVVGAAWLWFISSSLWYFPHSLSYFNELVGGPLNGHHVLIDSNIDWGQDLLYLKSWLEEHPEARPIGIAYFGQCDPRVLGIGYSLPPIGPTAPQDAPRSDDLERGPLPGWYAVSVSTLRGLHFALYAGDGSRPYISEPGFTYFQEFTPVARAGYSICIYHLSVDDVNPIRLRFGMQPVVPSEVDASMSSARIRTDLWSTTVVPRTTSQ